MRSALCLTAVVFAACSLPPVYGQRGGSSVPVYVGFDRNVYPGDAAVAELHKQFAFTGFWLTNPPGETTNSWAGKRENLRGAGFGFLVVANGRLDKEILVAQKRGTTAAQLGAQDGTEAAAVARREGFPWRTIIFLDQEEGGRMLPEQAAYLLGWTEAVAGTGFRPGVYASAQPVPDGPGATITTVQDIRARVTAGHLHPVAFWAVQDACPPAPGCVVQGQGPGASGTVEHSAAGDLIAWQYAQSPQRPEITRACARTYAADGNCYTPGPGRLFVDLSTSYDPDPSHGR